MTTRLGLISDVHASPVPLQQALELFTENNVDEIICAGDISGYFESLTETIELLKHYHCKTVVGNHDQTFLDSFSKNIESAEFHFLQNLPETLQFEVGDKSIYVVHANPPSEQHGGIKLLDQYGELIPAQKKYWQQALREFDFDVLIVGHTHQVYAEQLGDVFVVNPGSTQFNHSCMILDLPDLTVRTFALENRTIDKAWNFSKLFGEKNRIPRSHS